jgi:hypothetical protein
MSSRRTRKVVAPTQEASSNAELDSARKLLQRQKRGAAVRAKGRSWGGLTRLAARDIAAGVNPPEEEKDGEAFAEREAESPDFDEGTIGSEPLIQLRSDDEFEHQSNDAEPEMAPATAIAATQPPLDDISILSSETPSVNQTNPIQALPFPKARRRATRTISTMRTPASRKTTSRKSKQTDKDGLMSALAEQGKELLSQMEKQQSEQMLLFMRQMQQLMIQDEERRDKREEEERAKRDLLEERVMEALRTKEAELKSAHLAGLKTSAVNSDDNDLPIRKLSTTGGLSETPMSTKEHTVRFSEPDNELLEDGEEGREGQLHLIKVDTLYEKMPKTTVKFDAKLKAPHKATRLELLEWERKFKNYAISLHAELLLTSVDYLKSPDRSTRELLNATEKHTLLLWALRESVDKTMKRELDETSDPVDYPVGRVDLAYGRIIEKHFSTGLEELNKLDAEWADIKIKPDHSPIDALDTMISMKRFYEAANFPLHDIRIIQSHLTKLPTSVDIYVTFTERVIRENISDVRQYREQLDHCWRSLKRSKSSEKPKKEKGGKGRGKEDETGLLTTATSDKGAEEKGRGGTDLKGSTRKCFTCSQPGHISANCPYKHLAEEAGKREAEKVKQNETACVTFGSFQTAEEDEFESDRKHEAGHFTIADLLEELEGEMEHEASFTTIESKEDDNANEQMTDQKVYLESTLGSNRLKE